MSDQNQPSPKLASYWPALLAIVLVICSPIIALWVDLLVNHVLAWNSHEQCLVFFSCGAVLHAIGLLFWIRLAERNTIETERRYLVVSNILEHLGWALIFLALTLSEAHSQWHLLRELYFALGLVGSALVIGYYIVRYRHATEPLKVLEQKSSLFWAVVYLCLPALVLWRYFSGAQTLF